MHLPKDLQKRIGLLVLVYLTLLVFFKFSGMADDYGNGFRKVGNAIYGGTWGDKKVSLKTHKRQATDPPGVNTMLLIQKDGVMTAKKQRISKGSLLNTWNFACLPIVLLIALIVVLPVGWLQKGALFLMSYVTLNILLLLKLGLNIVAVIGAAQWFQWEWLNQVVLVMLPFLQIIEQHSIFALLISFMVWLYFSIDHLKDYWGSLFVATQPAV